MPLAKTVTKAAALLAIWLVPVLAFGQEAAPARILDFHFTPTARTQIALWIEKADGTFMRTVKLTQAVSYRGIGNRPGAAQMNSGFRWPYGRREGTLPVWAHRRAAAPGAEQFRRVIFQNRASEGDASRAPRPPKTNGEDSSPDAYFCLSFNQATTRKTELDAVACATPFSSDKGRFLHDDPNEVGFRPDDVDYSEPAVMAGEPAMRLLDFFSLYPPRRDVVPCSGCLDTADVAEYVSDARRVMPEIDVVTMATPPPDIEQTLLFSAPDDWPDGPYVAWIEVNVEGDYNGEFNDQTYPTPTEPLGQWDSWAMGYGYPYRGQPSVVFKVPFMLGASGTYGAATPAGYGDVDGFGAAGGELHTFVVGGVITDDPVGAKGSGADRLHLGPLGEHRVKVIVRDRKECEINVPPAMPGAVSVAPAASQKHSHEWGRLRFKVPTSTSPIAHYEARFSKTPIVPGDMMSFERAQPAVAAAIDTQALMIPTTFGAGAELDVEFGGMEPLTHYWVAVRAVDICNVPGPYAVAELSTTRIHYTQLSGCFIATAAYGSALEPQVGVLREARDALRPRSVLAAAATDLYYRSGPAAADVIAKSDAARAAVRTLLGPVIELAQAAGFAPAAASPPRPGR